MHRVLRVAAAATAALAMAGCGAGGQIPGHGRPEAGATRPAAAGESSAGAQTPAPTPTATVSGAAVTLGRATIPLTGVTRATRQGDYLCLTLADDTGCSLEVVDIGATRRSGGSVSIPAPGAQQGWWWGSDVASCGNGGETSPVTASTVVDKGFRKVGPKTAAYGSWRVTCENSDLDFDPRLWWLPTSMIAFRQHSAAAGSAQAVDKLLAAVTFGT